MMVFHVKKLDPARPYGIEIEGLIEEDLASETIRQQLRDLWIEHGLIIFRGEASNAFQVALGRVFGPLEIDQVKEILVEGCPELMHVRYDPKAEAIFEVNGRALGGWLPWHSDNVFVDEINHGGLLRAVTLTEKGGATGFIDQIEAYDALPDDIKSRIEDSHIVYKMRIDITRQRYASRFPLKLVRSSPFMESLGAREDVDFPPVVHPVVFVQPETGRKVLNVSPMFAEYIYGMDTPEGHALLRYLVDWVSAPERAHYHHWKVGEMLLWDNWRTIHSAEGVDPNSLREMQRATIAGDYALGRKLSEFKLLASDRMSA